MKTDILEMIKYKGLDLNDYNDHHELHEALDYDGSIRELVDGYIDLYYVDLRKWAVDNWNYVEEAMEEGLCEGVTDYHKIIQAGQYVYWSEQAREEVEAIFNEHLEAIEESVEG